MELNRDGTDGTIKKKNPQIVLCCTPDCYKLKVYANGDGRNAIWEDVDRTFYDLMQDYNPVSHTFCPSCFENEIARLDKEVNESG